jgi:hypothetical protein
LDRVPPRRDHAALLEEILMAFRQDDTMGEGEIAPPVGADVAGPEADEAGNVDD